MAKKKRQTLFVIFASPQQFGGPGNRYIAQDGSITDIRSKAARFYSWNDAKDFADEKGIVLGGPIDIGQEEFAPFEL